MKLEDLTSEQQKTLSALLDQVAAGKTPKLKKQRKTESGPAYLTEEEIERFFAAIPKSDLRSRAIFRLMYHRGLRVSEIGLLRLDDYRGGAGRIVVHRLKGSRGGEYLMVEPERQALKAWIRQRGATPGPLFESRNHGPLERTQIWRLMKKYCEAAGIPKEKAHPHALKHSCGTHLSAREPDIVAIQDHLGHAKLDNTMIYVRVSSRRRDELAERLDRSGWGKKGR
jgi:integrase